MNRKLISIGLVLVLIPLIGASCGQKAVERTAEKALEKASNGNVDIDINKNTVAVNINGGVTGQIGDDVKLPNDFPSDVYVVDGTIKTAIRNAERNGFSVSLQTTKTPAEVKALYDEKLKAQGWNETLSMNAGDGSTTSASKGTRTVTVIITSSDGVTAVMLSVIENPT